MRRIVTAIGVALTAAALTGCGGSGNDPADVVKAYVVAVVNGDGPTACNQLTTQAVEAVIRYAQQSHLGSSCPAYLSQGRGVFGGDARQAVHDAKFSTVSSSGNNAVVNVTSPINHKTQPVHLSNVDGHWFIGQNNSLLGLAGPGGAPSGGPSGGPIGSVDPASIESIIRTHVQQAGATPISVKCPGTIEDKARQTIDCTATVTTSSGKHESGTVAATLQHNKVTNLQFSAS